ncbi:rod shape-determining protein MreC [Desulfatirhabdium butyrativorans]|uniref:rod shape-determining protein MreC n=1 Tax=Desulfatirhabdium butyrativorans TaxID=340467 RepID=UPI000489FFC8|nr:rod shape-determining protein MreC [Desulfatirhabdium butyrativorans]
MLNRNVVIVLVLVLLIVVNMLILSISSTKHEVTGAQTQIGMRIVSPLQEALITMYRSARNVWDQYFWTLSVIQENDMLKEKLRSGFEERNRLKEVELENQRLHRLLDMRDHASYRSVVCQIVGKDPSPWFKTLIVDKGKVQGVQKGMSVLAPEGIVGQVIDVTEGFAKILLLVDGNCAVDAIGQLSRVRGIVKGGTNGDCIMQYVSRKDEIEVGETVISSGLDGVYRKGLPIGEVVSVTKQHSGMFQEITINPFVDFDRLEEVIIVLDRPQTDWGRP